MEVVARQGASSRSVSLVRPTRLLPELSRMRGIDLGHRLVPPGGSSRPTLDGARRIRRLTCSTKFTNDCLASSWRLDSMNMKNRLAKLEKIIGRGSTCPQCHGSPIRQICIYEEEPDGTQHLVLGTPPAPCPACGRMSSGVGISEIIAVRPAA